MTLEEARELVRQRAAAYERAKLTHERLAAVDVRHGDPVEYYLATAERDRAWELLMEAQHQFVRAEREDTP